MGRKDDERMDKIFGAGSAEKSNAEQREREIAEHNRQQEQAWAKLGRERPEQA